MAICDWGGWSTDFSHMTIVKYLVSENDNPSAGQHGKGPVGRRQVRREKLVNERERGERTPMPTFHLSLPLSKGRQGPLVKPMPSVVRP
jgi:hypothetical protein